MDITIIASATIAILSPYLAKAGEEVAKKAAGAAWQKVTAIHQEIKARLKKEKDDYPSQTLKRFEESPENRKGAMQDVLEEILSKDKAFAESLLSLLKEADKVGSGTTFNVTIFGGEVGEIINIDKLEDGFTINKKE